jgi:hypothetical protein
MKGILLTTLNAKYIHMNLAIRLLYELNKSDERLSWKEFVIKEEPNRIAEYCAEFEVVCFSCYIWNITHTLKVIDRIKSISPDTKILLGGPEVSYDGMELMQNKNIDFIITGGKGRSPLLNSCNPIQMFAALIILFPNMMVRSSISNMRIILNSKILLIRIPMPMKIQTAFKTV